MFSNVKTFELSVLTSVTTDNTVCNLDSKFKDAKILQHFFMYPILLRTHSVYGLQHNISEGMHPSKVD